VIDSNLYSRNQKEYFKELSEEASYITYTHTLHQFSLAILLTIEADDSIYKFPLTVEDHTRGRLLVEKLREHPDKEHVGAFHAFILPLLYARDLLAGDMDYSKWNEPLEGFMALHNLQEDGNFKPPHQVTQLFAQLHYHIRGAMLYEGAIKVADFGQNIYKLGSQVESHRVVLTSPLGQSSTKSRRTLIRLSCLPS
jgi:hypothetical protein